MKLIRKAGDTSNILQIFIQDSSSSTGAGLTGLVFNSGSLTAYYHRDTDTTATAITLVTMTVGTFTSSGFKEIDATNMPGWYQFCPPDAALAAGAKSVGFHLKGATNMAPLPIEMQLVGIDVQDATRGGMTALPNANANAVGGLPILDANSLIDVDVKRWLATAVTAATAGIPDTNVKNWNNVAVAALPANFTSLLISAGGRVSVLSNFLKNTALNSFAFMMTDATTHAPKTGLVVAVQRSIDGGAFANATNTPATELSNGDYTINLSAADMNGNVIMFKFTATGADDLNIPILTQP